MNNVQIHLNGTDLSSRRTAAVVRHQILEAVHNGNTISIDFADVHSISESYADEAFGVIVSSKGLNWLLENVHIKSDRDPVLKSIAQAIRRRLTELKQSVSDARSHA